LSVQNINDAMARWLTAFSESTSDDICASYDEHASLWGTVSSIKRDNPGLIKEYFDGVFQYTHRLVELDQTDIRLFGDMAISSGQYTFTWVKGGTKIITPARFSFVYKKIKGNWLIVEHHSSVIPPPL